VNLTTNAVQHRNRFSFGSLDVTNLPILRSVRFVSGFGFPFPANGVGKSLPFPSAASSPVKKNKWKKTVKAVVVRGKDKDVSSIESVDKDVKNVDLAKTGLSEEIKSDIKDSKINDVKKKMKKPSTKKDTKASAATDSSKADGEEVSRKSSSKGKKTNGKVSN
jgi:hypothetical protein